MSEATASSSNPYGLSDEKMAWIREQAKKDVVALVEKARQRREAEEAAATAPCVRTAEPPVSKPRILADEEVEQAAWECFDELDREEAERAAACEDCRLDAQWDGR